MARMSVDDSALRDPRVRRLARMLAEHLGPDPSRWPDLERRYALGCLLDVWALPYDRKDTVIPPEDVDGAALIETFTDLMVSAGLAAFVDRGVYIAGSEERTTYLRKQQQSGQNGGQKSGEVRRAKSKLANKTRRLPEAQLNPPDPVPDLVPDLAEMSRADRAPVAPNGKPRKRTSVERPKLEGYQATVDAFDRAYTQAHAGSRPTWGAKAGAQIKRLIKAHGASEVQRRIAVLFSAPPRWLQPPFDVGTLVVHFDKLVPAPQRAQSTGRVEPAKQYGNEDPLGSRARRELEIDTSVMPWEQ